MLGLSVSRENDLPLMPALPVLGQSISLLKKDNYGSLLDNQYVHTVSSGEAAIFFALKLHGVQAGDEVLVPAYHCPSMVDPVVRLGAKPVFFSITERINIDVADIKDKVSCNTKAILVPHFFGVRQDIHKLKKICELPNSVAVIEDCAHAFFVPANKHQHGDYIAASLTKFFPVYDGGVLVSQQPVLDGVIPLSVKQELKVIYNVVHDAVRFGRLKAFAWLFSLLALFKSSGAKGSDEVEESQHHENIEDSSEAYFESMSLSASKACEYIVAHADFDEIIKKRQQNYRFLIDKLSHIQHIDLSFNNTEDDFIPYMVIGRLSDPEKHHPRLISNKLPIWRWENIYPSDCEVSKEYSQSIIQIPCHQQLTQQELNDMVATIKMCLED